MSKQNAHDSGDGKEAILKSQVFPSANINHCSCTATMYDLNSKNQEKSSVSEAPVPSRDSIMMLRNIFVRNKQETTEKCFLKNGRDEIQPSTGETAASRRRISSFAKRISQKGYFLSKELGDNNVSNPTSSSVPWKKDVQNLKHVRRSNSTLNPKPTLVKSMKRTQRPTIVWEIPPLFQAYPQAVKYCCLSASTMSAEQILNSDNRQKNIFCECIAKLDQKHNPNRSKVCLEQTTCDRVAETSFSQRSHHCKSHKSVSTAEWTQKIFVLVTSGYLLQYSGSGSFDRMPEKSMQLGKNSVAFACDAIPGKHWVLQVSQSMDSDGHSLSNSKSLFSRLSPRNTGHKKTCKSFLLVFDSAEELETWISVLRREIKSIGTRQHNQETIQSDANENPIPFKQPCQKPLAQGTINYSPHSASNEAEHKMTEDDPKIHNKVGIDSRIPSKHLSVATFRSSIGNFSITNSFVSQDGRILQSLSGSQHRSSYMSSDQRTMMTSQCSSPNTSPKLWACDHNYSKRLTGDSNVWPICNSTIENRNSLLSLGNHSHESVSSSYQNSYGTTSRGHSPSNHNSIGNRSGIKNSVPKASQAATTSNSYDERSNNPLDNFPKSKRPLSYYGNIQEPYNAEELSCEASITDLKNYDTSIYLPPVVHTSQPMIDPNLFKNIGRDSETPNYNVEPCSNALNKHLINPDSSLCDRRKDNLETPRTPHRIKDVKIKQSCQAKSSPSKTGSNLHLITPTHETITSPRHITDQFYPQSHSRVLSHQYAEDNSFRASNQHKRCNSLGPKYRRSLPSLLNGPPLLPPPKCALPPLPSRNFVKSRLVSVDKVSRSISNSYT